jgi:hypothetical protein
VSINFRQELASGGKQRALLQERMILVLGEKAKHFSTKP